MKTLLRFERFSLLLDFFENMVIAFRDVGNSSGLGMLPAVGVLLLPRVLDDAMLFLRVHHVLRYVTMTGYPLDLKSVR